MFLSTGPSPSFLLAGNPLVCSCELEWLSTYTAAASPFPSLADYPALTCAPPTRPRLAPLPLAEVAQELFLCNYSSHCFSLCRCCTFLACDCRMKCPDSCSCFHDQVTRIGFFDHKLISHFLRELYAKRESLFTKISLRF
jgi:hypothetical protein